MASVCCNRQERQTYWNMRQEYLPDRYHTYRIPNKCLVLYLQVYTPLKWLTNLNFQIIHVQTPLYKNTHTLHYCTYNLPTHHIKYTCTHGIHSCRFIMFLFFIISVVIPTDMWGLCQSQSDAWALSFIVFHTLCSTPEAPIGHIRFGTKRCFQTDNRNKPENTLQYFTTSNIFIYFLRCSSCLDVFRFPHYFMCSYPGEWTEKDNIPSVSGAAHRSPSLPCHQFFLDTFIRVTRFISYIHIPSVFENYNALDAVALGHA